MIPNLASGDTQDFLRNGAFLELPSAAF